MSNYTRGRTKEYQVKKILEDRGLEVVRSASSKGLWDVTAAGLGYTYLIQVKYTKAKKYYEDANCKKLRELIVGRDTKKELWVFFYGNKTPDIISLD
jgi:Holliday junction resolvase